MTWSRKIRELRRALQVSQDGLALRLSVTKKSVAEWEQGRQPPSPERALQMARLIEPGPLRRWFTEFALNRIGTDSDTVLASLLGTKPGAPLHQGPLQVPELRIVASLDHAERFRALERSDHFVPVPVLHDAAAAGEPAQISEGDIEGYTLIPYAWCPNPQRFTCLRVRGDSMVPILSDGSLVGVDHSQRNPDRLHQKMVAARVEDGVTIKWLDRRPGGGFQLVAENRSYPSIELSPGRYNPVIGLIAWWWSRPR